MHPSIIIYNLSFNIYISLIYAFLFLSFAFVFILCRQAFLRHFPKHAFGVRDILICFSIFLFCMFGIYYSLISRVYSCFLFFISVLSINTCMHFLLGGVYVYDDSQ